VLITTIGGLGTKAKARGVDTGYVIGSCISTITSDVGSMIKQRLMRIWIKKNLMT